MPFDWFTVGAQLLNFLILVGLLKHFLYGPILDAIDAREKRITDELADAEEKRDEADSERDAFQEKSRELDQKREELLAKARDDAGSERHRLIEQARADADDIRARRDEALEREYGELKGELVRLTGEQVFAIARKTLGDLSGAGIAQRMCEVFAERLRKLDEDAKERLKHALETSSGPALVRSSHELPEEQRDRIRQVLDELFPPSVDLRFETSGGLVGGVELVANGQKLAWSIADYLATMEQAVGGLLESRSTHTSESG